MKMSIIQVFYKIFEYFINNVFPLMSAGLEYTSNWLEVTHTTQSAEILQKKDEWNKSCASSAQVHELPLSHWRINNNMEGTLSVFLTIYIHI